MKFKKEELIKSPLNYTGGKYKLLPQILPYFPENIDSFYDLFAGGCNVGINVKANNIVCNDNLKQIIDLMNYWSSNTENYLNNKIKYIINKYSLSESSLYGYEYYNCNSNNGLSKYNDLKWRKLREDYNTNKDIELLYPLIVFTFNNNIKFDSDNNFIAGGCNKRDFNKSLEKNFIKYIDRLNEVNIKFTSKDFKELKIDDLNSQDFVYCDPPYLVTKATYNDGWNETYERELLELLDKLNEKGIRFALSNVLENKGKSNDILKEWCKKYNTYHLNNTYGNCSYHAKDKSNNSTDEVLVTNYQK
ncbi:Dam family site-specific DNA-(adenine-N6)-methyltransferase [Clostridium butyricum]|uniref:Dam family site-specific DNA-(adenine-N6)-methyltransferase n=1 Tax=Clostridium butyricum TaxID=1492 RepID=UPI00325B5095